jgi:CheY-like chemotaxis protein
VLLAEDEDALRVLIARVLAGSGYEVIAGRNGVEALEAARARGRRVDLLLTDVVMPRMSGAELAAELTRDHAGVKVLFMTGHLDDPSLLGRFSAADVEIVQKPFTNEALLGHIRRLLGAGKASAAPYDFAPPVAALRSG